VRGRGRQGHRHRRLHGQGREYCRAASTLGADTTRRDYFYLHPCVCSV
jgi:hypothetical protein